jgi:peptide maturation system protein (TIGR04066 family)
MGEKEKILVYPYDLHFAPVVRHRHMLQGLEIGALVSPAGWGLAGKDASAADGGADTGIPVSGDFDGNLPDCDTVLFTGFEKSLDRVRHLFPLALKAIKAGRNIILAAKIEEQALKDIREACAGRGVTFRDVNGSHGPDLAACGEGELREITVPVIAVLGIGEQTNKFEIQLSIREKLMAMGYRVSQIGSRNGCELLGFHSFPDFMFSGSLDETAKVLLFNHYVKSLETGEAPDVIVLGIPGGIVPFNSQFANGFGITAFEVFQAVLPDANVVSVFFEEGETGYFDRLAQTIRHRFGFEPDCFNMANRMPDLENSRMMKKLVYTNFDAALTDKAAARYGNYRIPVGNILGNSSGINIADHVVSRLVGYGEAVCV